MELNAYITNLGKYNEGELVGKWVTFPITTQELKKVFREIGIGIRYEEFFITDYDIVIDGISQCLGEYENLEQLNYLAGQLSDLSDYDLHKYSMILESGLANENCIEDLINLSFNLDNFDFYPDICDESALGYYYVEDAGIYNLEQLGGLRNYIDYEKFGRDIALEEGGNFTNSGYVRGDVGSWMRVYDCKSDSVPEEYKLYKPIQEIKKNKTVQER